MNVIKSLLIAALAVLVMGGAVFYALYQSAQPVPKTEVQVSEQQPVQQPAQQPVQQPVTPVVATTTTVVQVKPVQKTPPPVVAPKPAQGVQIAIDGYAFIPSSLTVKAGTKVTWTNKQVVKHTVTKDAGMTDGPDSDYFGQGESYSYTFTTPGTYSYHCDPHPYMQAKITVTP